MSKPLAEFAGSALYLDTMIFYMFLRGGNAPVADFFSRVRSGEFSVYTSVLTFDELSYRLILGLIHDHHRGSPLEHLRNDEARMIEEVYPHIAPQIAELRTFPNLSFLDMTATDLDFMNDVILRHHIRPRDALHLAAMQKCGCFDLLSNDTDFDRVPFVQRYTLTS